MLELVGKNPLDPKSWKKSVRPAFESVEHTYGVGHSCFVQSPDGREWWHIYHSKQSREPGWNRDVMMQPFSFDEKGSPVLGKPVKRGEKLDRPSGE
jgi:GH43 family beta-xylosidase